MVESHCLKLQKMESIYIQILTKIVKWKYIKMIHVIEIFNSNDDTYYQILIYIPYDYAYPNYFFTVLGVILMVV